MSTSRFSGNRRWIAIGAAVVAVLVIVGLLLPPVSVLERSGIVCTGTTLNADSPAVTTPDGLTVALSDTSRPLTFKTVAVEQAQYETGQAGEDLSTAQLAQPAQLVLRSPIYRLSECGQGPVSASIAVALPAGAQADQTYDLYGWNGQAWSWLGAYADSASGTVSAQVEKLPKNVALFQSTSTAPAVSAQVRPGQMLPAAAAETVTEAFILGWTIANDGAIVATAGELPDTGKAKLYPVVQSLEAAPVQNILASEESTKAHLDKLSELAARKNFAGLAIDYRGLPAEDRAAFTKLIAQLADRLHAENRTLAVVLPAPAIDQNGAPDTAGYDWVAIGNAVDIVQADFGQDPANYLSGKAGYALVDWAPSQIDRYKFQPIYSVASLATQDGKTVEVPFAEAIKPIGLFTFTAPISITPGSPLTLTLSNPTQVSDFGYDDTTHTYRFTYVNNGKPREVVVKTARTLAHQLELLLPRHMRGALITGLEGDIEPASLAQALQGYRQQAVPQELPTPFDLQWKIELANGQVITITRPITDTTYVWTVPNQAGEFKIAALVGSQPHGEGRLSITAALSDTAALSSTASLTTTASVTTTAVATTTVAAELCLSSSFVADVTIPDGTKLKNAETFTKTWRINNNGQCNWPDDTTLVFVSGTKLGSPDSVQVGAVVSGTQKDISVQLKAPDQYGNYTGLWQLKSAQGNFGTQMSAVIVAGDPPAGGNVVAGGNPPPAQPVSLGGFELGGQVNCYPSNPALMRRAGMTWVKIQVGKGCGLPIADMHNLGFKVLVSAVSGDHSQANDEAFQNKFAADLASYAAQGADAIEVWNEMNIDQEWPVGTINAASYVRMLQKAYPAIKAANPNTIVISGAPAPTGFFGGCGANGCDDAPYVASMFASGAANYVDCIGVHYNEGIVPPTQTSGDPRSDHYTRYFWGMVNAYWNASGGSRKLCFTELGYLTPEGMGGGPLGPGFGWAQNTTVAQQAQWLASAASLAASSGKVRLMIVWNADFKDYNPNGDPKGGYAIIRPGDSCPACDALGAVVGSR